MSSNIDVVTEAGEIRRRSILVVLGAVSVFLPIAAFTAANAVEQVAYPVAVLPFALLFYGGITRRVGQRGMELGLLVLGTMLLTVLFWGSLLDATTVEELVATSTSFGPRNWVMLAAGSFLLLGPQRALDFSVAVLVGWAGLTFAVSPRVGGAMALLGHGDTFVRALLSAVVTLAVLWALTSQNVVWASGEEAARRLAEIDHLTGLANRRRLLRTMDSLITGPMDGFAVALVDVDHFKNVNDEHGHDVGDVALSTIARVLADEVRSGDLVARWGGEEFVVLFAGVTADQAVTAAERCRIAIAEARPRRESDPWFPELTASFGLVGQREGDTPADILRRADEQLYRAKQAGRNRVCVEPDLLGTPSETNVSA